MQAKEQKLSFVSEFRYFLIFCFNKTHLGSDDAYLEIFWHQVCNVNRPWQGTFRKQGLKGAGKGGGFISSFPFLSYGGLVGWRWAQRREDEVCGWVNSVFRTHKPFC